MRYVALLRGINVGGKNLIKMTELKTCLEKQGFTDVSTYIQSGNVLFTTAGYRRDELTRRIEKSLTQTFNYPASVVLRTRKQIEDIVKRAPPGYGSNSAKYRYNVIFLKEPLTASMAMKGVLTKQGVDEARAGVGVLYFSLLISKASQSQLSRIVGTPIYQSMTIRNWNTTTKLLQVM
ncbi:MAG TPA: DUF1697 domain-containing protein [Polyangiaceae bacterium]|nr:DUF1697 domain-containing protein [Polyangiaceae bacterium]